MEQGLYLAQNRNFAYFEDIHYLYFSSNFEMFEVFFFL